MAMPNLNGGARVMGVRLTDIPLPIRRRYGGYLLERAIKELDPMVAIDFAAELHRAVEEPSNTVYWLPAQVVTEVRKKW